MKRTTDVMQDRIVEAAAQLFSRRGFSGTSTREIARLAAVNETSIFRHFPRKQDLFWTALQSRMQRLRVRKELMIELAGNGKPERVFRLLAEFLVHASTYQPDTIRLMYFALMEVGPDAEHLYREKLGPTFRAVHDYMARAMQNNLLRSMDPALATVAFTSSILAYEQLLMVMSGDRSRFANSNEAISAFAGFWLNALAYPAPSPPMQKDHFTFV